MSQKRYQTTWLIEWSPHLVVATNTATNASIRADSFRDLKGQVQGKVLIALSRRSTYLKVTRLPNAKAAELLAIVQMHAAQLFPQVQGVLAYGFKLTSDVNAEGRMAVISAVPVSLLEKLYQEASIVGIQIDRIVAAGIGAGLLANELGIQNATVVEDGFDGTTIDIVLDGNTMYSRISGSEDIAAEIDRTVVASGFPPSQVIGSKNSRAGDLKSKSTISESIVDNASELSTLLLELPTLVLKREKAIVSSRARFSVIMALAAIGFGLVTLNLRDEAQQTVYRQNIEASRHIRSWTKERDRIVIRKSSASAVFDDLKRAFQPAQPMTDVITAVSNDIPTGVWLTGVSIERGKPLLLRGIAMSHEALGVYLQSLNSNERFRESKLAFANQTLIESTNVVQFSISSHVVGNFPTVKTKQERSKK